MGDCVYLTTAVKGDDQKHWMHTSAASDGGISNGRIFCASMPTLVLTWDADSFDDGSYLPFRFDCGAMFTAQLRKQNKQILKTIRKADPSRSGPTNSQPRVGRGRPPLDSDPLPAGCFVMKVPIEFHVP